MAGLKPQEIYEMTFKELMGVVSAYDQRMIEFFNLNTRVLAWHSVAPHIEKGKMTPFNSFLKIDTEEDKIESISDRANMIRQIYYEKGYLKPRKKNG